MTRAQRIREFFHPPSPSPSQVAHPAADVVHKATHNLVHPEALRKAQERTTTFRTILQDKRLPKAELKALLTQIQADTYKRHYRQGYPSTRREVQKEMTRNSAF